MSAPIDIHLLSLFGIIIAVCIAISKQYRIFKTSFVFLVLFGLTGIPDTIATIEFAYLKPEIESNPLTKLFLQTPYMIMIGVFMWTFGWLSLAEFFERINMRFVSRAVLIGLFIGHMLGFISWSSNMNLDFVILIYVITIMILGIMYFIYRVWYHGAQVKQ